MQNSFQLEVLVRSICQSIVVVQKLFCWWWHESEKQDESQLPSFSHAEETWLIDESMESVQATIFPAVLWFWPQVWLCWFLPRTSTLTNDQFFRRIQRQRKYSLKNQTCSIITNLNLKSLCWIEWDNFSMFFKQDNSLFSWLHFGLWPLSLAKPCFHSISSEPQRMNKLARTHAYSTNSRFYWHSYLVPAASSGKQPLIPSLDQKGQKGEGCHASFPMTPCLPVLT